MTNITGTRAAFEAMLKERAVYHKLGVTRKAVTEWRKRLRQNKYITLDLMEKYLTIYGATVVKEKTWRMPK